MPKNKMKAEDIIQLIPDKLLNDLADKTGVDYSVQKLHGKVVFKLFLFAFLNCRRISLRILEEIFKSQKFKRLFNIHDKTIKHSSLGMRLRNIDYRYFEQIFLYLIKSPKLESIFFGDKKIAARKIDSTLVTISAKLLTFGMENENGHKKNVKYSLELTGGLPINIMLFTEQPAFSEDYALPEVVRKQTDNNRLNIAIFDRGIQRKKTFTDFIDRHIYFISRLHKQGYIVNKDSRVYITDSGDLTILSDQIIQFAKWKNDRRKPVILPQQLRLIIGKNKEKKQVIKFITNVDFLSASEVADLYKSRWEIETFFKFIKQEQNFSHLISRNENGIKAVMYLTMITAILLTIYKKLNLITGWAVAKIRFMDELEISVLKEWYDELHPLFAKKAPSLSQNTS